MQQSSSLDFTIFGVARSGTTALMEAANLHPRVYCSLEWNIGLDATHASLQFPKAYLTEDDLQPHDDVRLDDRRLLDAKLARGRRLLLGNKKPIYFWHMDLLDRCFPRARHTVIYRSPMAFTGSWNARAGDRGDQGWHRGQVGLFGIFEWLIVLDTIARHHADISVVSYEATFLGDATTFLSWMAHLGAPVHHGSLAALFERRMRLPATSEEERIRNCSYLSFLDEIGVPSIDAKTRDHGISSRVELGEAYQKFVASRAEEVGRYVAKEVRSASDPSIAAFGRLWAGQLTRMYQAQEWRDRNLLAAAETLAGQLTA